MKKLVFIMAVVFFSATAFGQTKTTTEKPQQKQAVKTEQAKTTEKPATVAAAQAPVKKGGTPNKKHKENKEAPIVKK